MEDNLVTEYIESLDLNITQNDKYFKYGIDSFLITDFAYEEMKGEVLKKVIKNKNYSICDICTGSGIIGIMFFKKILNKLKNISYTGNLNNIFLEKQQYFTELCKLNIEQNKLIDKNNIFDVLTYDVNENIDNNKLKKYKNTVDLILSNPPYKKYLSGIDSNSDEKDIAKKENANFLNNFFKTSKYLLKQKGCIIMINRPERIIDIFENARKYNIEPKIIKFIQNKNKKNKLVIIKFVNNANEFLKFLENEEI